MSMKRSEFNKSLHQNKISKEQIPSISPIESGLRKRPGDWQDSLRNQI